MRMHYKNIYCINSQGTRKQLYTSSVSAQLFHKYDVELLESFMQQTLKKLKLQLNDFLIMFVIIKVMKEHFNKWVRETDAPSILKLCATFRSRRRCYFNCFQIVSYLVHLWNFSLRVQQVFQIVVIV